MRQYLRRIFGNYLASKQVKRLHELRTFIGTQTANYFRSLVDSRLYTVKASAGAGIMETQMQLR